MAVWFSMTKVGARDVAYELLRSVQNDGAYANLALPKLIAKASLDSRDAGLAQELAFGSIRNQLFYDRIIELCANRKIEKIDAKSNAVLRLGIHQLLAMRIPSHAAINETVSLAKSAIGIGAGGFVNGILRRVSERDRSEWLQVVLQNHNSTEERLSITYSHPIWIVRALKAALQLDGRQHELEDLLRVDNEAPAVNLVALPGFSCNVDGLVPGVASPIGFTMESGDPAKLESVAAGSLRVQDQGSQLAALALTSVTEVAAGERWLDMCAGPGGKAALLAATAKMVGAHLIANEISKHRAKLVEDALHPIAASVDIECGDGRRFGETNKAQFDRILVDAPCTGLGALRRRAEARWRKQPSDVPELANLQQELLESAFNALKLGGIIAYVTCSPHTAETVAVVDWLVRKRGGSVELLDTNETLERINPRLKLNRNRKTSQLWPQIHDTDAMFIALIKRVG